MNTWQFTSSFLSSALCWLSSSTRCRASRASSWLIFPSNLLRSSWASSSCKSFSFISFCHCRNAEGSLAPCVRRSSLETHDFELTLQTLRILQSMTYSDHFKRCIFYFSFPVSRVIVTYSTLLPAVDYIKLPPEGLLLCSVWWARCLSVTFWTKYKGLNSIRYSVCMIMGLMLHSDMIFLCVCVCIPYEWLEFQRSKLSQIWVQLHGFAQSGTLCSDWQKNKNHLYT